MQATYNGVDKRLQYLFQNANHVEFTQTLASGTQIGELSIDGNSVNLYAPAGGGGGGVSDVRVDNVSVVDSNHIAQLNSSDFGTTVIANPSASATDDLTKVQIGNTVYDIPGGGGGGGGQQYTCDLLFVNDPLPSPTSGNANTTRSYTLSHSINDYDAVVVTSIGAWTGSGTGSEGGTMFILKDDYQIGENNHWFKEINNSWGSDTKVLCFGFTDDTHITTHGGRQTYGVEPMLHKVYGLKFAASVINNPVYLSDYYSEEERVVGRWTDGKPLYQKTFTIASMPNNAAVEINHNIQNVDIIWVYDGYASNPNNNGFTNQLNLPNISIDRQWYVAVTKTIIQMWAGQDRSAYNDVKVTLRYTKTTDLPNSGPTPGNLIYLPTIYSEEKRQVGVDTDGRPLYQRTYKISVDHTSTASYYLQSYAHGISNLNPDSVRFEASIIANSGSVRPLVFDYGTDDNTSSSWNGNVFADDTYLLFELGRQLRANTDRIVVTIKYTKTTDTPGSGTWTPDGNLSHHYSNTEHIVGTWIDGSTIWERTWDLGSDLSLSENVWVDTTIPNTNMSMITHSECVTSSGAHRGQIEANPNTSGSYVTLRSDGINATVRYVTLQYTKSS